MRRVVLVALGLAAVSLWLFAAAPPDVKKYESKVGVVSFRHQAHVKAGLTCRDCHHSPEAVDRACATCHGKEAADRAPRLFDAIHGEGVYGCTGCHAKTAAAGRKSGPLRNSCAVCHRKG